MTVDLLNIYAIPLVFTKSTASFIVTFGGVIVFFSGLVILAASISAYFKALAAKNRQGVHRTLAIGLISISFSSIAITQTGIIKYKSVQNERLEELCKTANFQVYKTVSGVDNIYIDADQTIQIDGGYLSGGSLGKPLLNSDLIQFYEAKNIDNKTDKSMKYIKVSRDGEHSLHYLTKESKDIESGFSILTSDLASTIDKIVGINGSDVKVTKDNKEILAHLRYFWIDNKRFCPSTNNRLLPTQTILYVFGFQMAEETKRRVIEGLTQ